jgi:uncharacterized delta-60 repeat protein
LLSTGGLDPTFGSGGVVETTYPAPGFAIADQVAVDPRNGDLVVVGDMGDNSVPELVMTRYLPTGQLDTTFGNAGEVVVRNVSRPNAVVVQPDGAIVVAAGLQDPQFYAASVPSVGRFNSNGTLDASFGNNGWTSDLGFPEGILALQSDGKILVAGGGWIGRLTTLGQWDTSFNGTGKTAPVFPAYAGYSAGDIVSIVPTPDGKILAAGGIVLFRLTSTGQLDTDPATGFGTLTGGAGSPYSGFDLANYGLGIDHMGVTPIGQILVTGYNPYGPMPLKVELCTLFPLR